MPNWLKWIVLLPVSLAAMAVVRFLNRMTMNTMFGQSSGIFAMLDELFITAAATGAYIYVGTLIAPAHKFATAVVLSILYSLLSVVAFTVYVSQYGDILPAGDKTYDLLGVAVAVATCIAFCVVMFKEKYQTQE